MNFQKLILSVLNEAIDTDNKTVKEWLFVLDDKSKEPKSISSDMTDIKNAYDRVYLGGFPDFSELLKIYNNWLKCWTRTSATPFLDYGMYFPVIEFIAQLAHLVPASVKDYTKRFEEEKIHKSAFESLEKKFIKALGGVPTKNPMDFPTITPEGQYVATQIKKRNGQMYVAQENLNKYQGESIKNTIFYMLEVRKKARLATVKNKNVPDQGKEVYDVLLNPEKYSGGDQAFSTKVSSDKVYTRAVYNELLHLGLSARRYFDYEINRLFAEEKDPSTGKFDPLGPIQTQTSYDMFLNNSSVEDNFFAFPRADGTTLKAEDVGQGGYNIKNIKAQAAKNDAAADFYELLEKFADYIREGEIIDWIEIMRGATQIANAASFGAPTVGGKR